MIFNLGAVIGGFLSMVLNWNEQKSSTNPASYFVFVVLMLLGSLGSLALANPNKVIREDGAPVIFDVAKSVKDEIFGAFLICKHEEMFRLTILFLVSIWFYPYQFNA